MSTATILVGVLVGWASTVCWNRATMGNPWVSRLIGVIGGLVGAYLATTIGSGEALATVVWAWAGAVVLGDIVNLVSPGN